MNETLRQLKSRKSVRIFEDKAVPPEIKQEILNAAFEAPTAGAMMLYTILDITDQALKEKLAIACDNQPFIAKAPLVLIFLADFQRWYDTFYHAECHPRKPEVGDLLLANADALIAAQNTVVAAEALGLGSCYIGDILENCETVRELLNLPDYVMPAAMLVYGYPSESQKDRQKPERFDARYLVRQNQYQALTKEELMAMQQSTHPDGLQTEEAIKTYIQKFCTRKYMSDFSLEMSRSACAYIKAFTPDKTC